MDDSRAGSLLSLCCMLSATSFFVLLSGLFDEAAWLSSRHFSHYTTWWICAAENLTSSSSSFTTPWSEAGWLCCNLTSSSITYAGRSFEFSLTCTATSYLQISLDSSASSYWTVASMLNYLRRESCKVSLAQAWLCIRTFSIRLSWIRF